MQLISQHCMTIRIRVEHKLENIQWAYIYTKLLIYIRGSLSKDRGVIHTVAIAKEWSNPLVAGDPSRCVSSSCYSYKAAHKLFIAWEWRMCQMSFAS